MIFTQYVGKLLRPINL